MKRTPDHRGMILPAIIVVTSSLGMAGYISVGRFGLAGFHGAMVGFNLLMMTLWSIENAAVQDLEDRIERIRSRIRELSSGVKSNIHERRTRA